MILPQLGKQVIAVEHCSSESALQRLIVGKDARSIYGTILRNGWVTQLSHSAYLGKELVNARLAIMLGAQCARDGAWVNDLSPNDDL